MYLLGIDIGPTGTKSVIFDDNLQFISKGYAEYSVFTPKTGWMEHNPNIWLNTVAKNIKIALQRAFVSPEDILEVKE